MANPMASRDGMPRRKLTPEDLYNEVWSEAKYGDLVIYEDGYIGLEDSWLAPNRVENGKYKIVWSGQTPNL